MKHMMCLFGLVAGSALASGVINPISVLEPGVALRVAQADAPTAGPPAAVEAAPVLAPPPSPAVQSTPPAQPAPSAGLQFKDATVEASSASGALGVGVGLGARASGMLVQPFATDNAGTRIKDDPVDTKLRLSGSARYDRFSVNAQADFAGGAAAGVPSGTGYIDPPHPGFSSAELRKLFLQYKGDTWVFRAGQQTSQWGLGIVANGGEHDPAPGEAFGDVRFGDLVYRALIAARPFYSLGGIWRAIEPALGADLVVKDETATYSAGDRALQGVFALRFAVDDDHWAGIYTVYRHQTSIGSDSATHKLDAVVLDAAGKWRWSRAVMGGALNFGAEATYITGNTTLAATQQQPSQAVRQFGGAIKSSLRFDRWEGYLDLGYASGDQNPYGDTLTGFRFNPDYNVGLVMFQEVLGWQTARSAARASDPSLTGQPPAGVQLLPSQGGVFNAAYAFPRVRYAFQPWVDFYGGPLFAFATAKLTDPYNTTAYGGGSPVNSLGGSAGGYLGTELDVGAQVRARPAGIPVTATAELGYFVPGDAFVDASGKVMPPVAAGRVRLAIPF